MMRRYLLPFLLLGLLAPSTVLAQGAFLERNAYGFLLEGGLAPAQEGGRYQVGAGFSIAGTLDAGGRYGWLEEHVDSLGASFTGHAVTPRLTLHLVKPTERIPFSLSAVSAYQFVRLNGPDDATLEGSGRRWHVGGELATTQQLRGPLGLRASFSVAYARRDIDYRTAGDVTTFAQKGGSTRIGGAVDLIFMPLARSVLYVGPHIVSVFGETSFGASLGIVFI